MTLPYVFLATNGWRRLFAERRELPSRRCSLQEGGEVVCDDVHQPLPQDATGATLAR